MEHARHQQLQQQEQMQQQLQQQNQSLHEMQQVGYPTGGEDVMPGLGVATDPTQLQMLQQQQLLLQQQQQQGGKSQGRRSE
ncbi:hypothetical protein ACSSS7_001207 [Eimeria intestinalis]